MNQMYHPVFSESSLPSLMADKPTFVTDYEAPGIEAVLTSEEVEREILYAGSLTPPIPFNPIPD